MSTNTKKRQDGVDLTKSIVCAAQDKHAVSYPGCFRNVFIHFKQKKKKTIYPWPGFRDSLSEGMTGFGSKRHRQDEKERKFLIKFIPQFILKY